MMFGEMNVTGERSTTCFEAVSWLRMAGRIAVDFVTEVGSLGRYQYLTDIYTLKTLTKTLINLVSE